MKPPKTKREYRRAGKKAQLVKKRARNNPLDRREIRRRLGSRTTRRKGTKTQGIADTAKAPANKMTHWGHPRAPRRVSVRVEAAIRKLATQRRANSQAI